jgi:curved DNA-binding protein CbpA
VTHYEVLGVAPSASAAEIKRAYRRQARQHHPDVAGNGDAAMRALNRAWETLGDPARRRAYDRTLGVGLVPPSPAAPSAPPVFTDEGDDEDEEDWGPEPEPPPPTKRDVFLFVPVALLACAAVCVGLAGLLYAPVLLGAAVFFVAVAAFAFALVPILTLRRQARRTYR